MNDLERGQSAESSGPERLIGRRLNHFRVDALLGRGGMGAVYRAFDESLERPVALKVLLRDSPELRTRFMREARAQATLRHPNVLPIHFVGEDDGIAFLVMDLVEGESLAGLLAREGQLGPERALDVTEAISRALGAAAEKGIVHRDVKPSNVLIDSKGHILLADFGLAKRVGEDQEAEPVPGPDATPDAATKALTHVGVLVGTPQYMAPEQTRRGRVDLRTDIYALGITLYEALAGQPPFTGERHSGLIEQHRTESPLSPRLLVPDIKPSVEALVLRMIAKDPDARFSTHDELRRAIEAARHKPFDTASFFSRGVALSVDALSCAIFGALAKITADWAIALAIAVILGIVEGRFGTTLGKRLLRLKTLGPHDESAGYARSLARNALKLWGPIVFGALKALVPVGTALSVAEFVAIAAWIVGFLVAMGPRGLALHDRIVGTRVVIATGA